METLEELKAIIAGKPEGATHIDDDGDYIRYELGKKAIEYRCDVDGWWEVDFSDFNLMRSLSDIERIIELMEATQGILQILAGSPDGYWRNEIKAARKALGYE